MRMRMTTVAVVMLGVMLVGCGDKTITAKQLTTTTTAAASTTTPTTVPPTTTTVARTTEGPLGTTFTVTPGDRKITAFTFKSLVTSSNQFNQPAAGNLFAAAEVQECAGPAGEKFSPNRFDFELAMADNTRVRAGIEVQTPQLASSPLLPGDCIRGWVTFEVPASGKPQLLVYSVGNANAKWRL